MTLERTLTRIDQLLGILEHHARTGFFAGTEPAEAVTLNTDLRIKFGLILEMVPTFTPDQALEAQTDFSNFLTKLERRIAPLLESKRVQA